MKSAGGRATNPNAADGGGADARGPSLIVLRQAILLAVAVAGFGFASALAVMVAGRISQILEVQREVARPVAPPPAVPPLMAEEPPREAWMDLTGASVTSKVTESPEYSLAVGKEAQKLTDGREETLAYPGAPVVDYAVEFGEVLDIERVRLVWGEYGIQPHYIHRWTLFGKQGGSFEPLAQGGFPQRQYTVLNVPTTVSGLRIRAESDENWIGIYELRVEVKQETEDARAGEAS